MRSELRVRPHLLRAGEVVIEVWYDGRFVASVTAADGPSVSVVSKYGLVTSIDSRAHVPNVIRVEVAIDHQVSTP